MNNSHIQKCLTDRQMRMSVDMSETVLFGYVMPVIVLFGVTGNLINLTVLLTPGMRTRSNILLAALALADTIFLLVMTPHSMAHYNVFVFDYNFRTTYLHAKMHLIGLANWMSALAIWLTLAICLERVLGIRYPLHSRIREHINVYTVIVTLIVITFLLTFYTHIMYHCVHRVFCNGTQPHSYCFPVASELLSPKISAICVIFLPTVVICAANLWLIMTLHERRRFLQLSSNMHSPSALTGATTGVVTSHVANQIRNEQRITLTICAIVTSFTLTQAPSALLQVTPYDPFVFGVIRISTLSNFMVCVGKSLNFLLFCMSSKNFRRKLVQLTKTRINVARSRRRQLSSNDTVMTMCNGSARYPSMNTNTRRPSQTPFLQPGRACLLKRDQSVQSLSTPTGSLSYTPTKRLSRDFMPNDWKPETNGRHRKSDSYVTVGGHTDAVSAL